MSAVYIRMIWFWFNMVKIAHQRDFFIRAVPLRFSKNTTISSSINKLIILGHCAHSNNIDPIFGCLFVTKAGKEYYVNTEKGKEMQKCGVCIHTLTDYNDLIFVRLLQNPKRKFNHHWKKRKEMKRLFIVWGLYPHSPWL